MFANSCRIVQRPAGFRLFCAECESLARTFAHSVASSSASILNLTLLKASTSSLYSGGAELKKTIVDVPRLHKFLECHVGRHTSPSKRARPVVRIPLFSFAFLRRALVGSSSRTAEAHLFPPKGPSNMIAIHRFRLNRLKRDRMGDWFVERVGGSVGY